METWHFFMKEYMTYLEKLSGFLELAKTSKFPWEYFATNRDDKLPGRLTNLYDVFSKKHNSYYLPFAPLDNPIDPGNSYGRYFIPDITNKQLYRCMSTDSVEGDFHFKHKIAYASAQGAIDRAVSILGITPEKCNTQVIKEMTEYLNDLIYARDTNTEPPAWEYQFDGSDDMDWEPCPIEIEWSRNCIYRRKQKRVFVNGVELIDNRLTASEASGHFGKPVWVESADGPIKVYKSIWTNHPYENRRLELGIVHKDEESAKEFFNARFKV